MTRLRIIIIMLIWYGPAATQTLGGSSAYNFLKLPATPLLTAAGGVNASYNAGEVGLATSNPSLLQRELHGQLNLSFTTFPAGITAYSIGGAMDHRRLETVFAGHIYFLDYGSIPMTDASGMVNGEFRPVDYVVQLSAARKYLQNWTYGASVKFIRSDYQQFRSSAVAVDVGLLYSDTANDFTASVVAKNMGLQLSTYAGIREDLPFELQLGITKRLSSSPFGFSLTAQHLQTFDILYRDEEFNSANNFPDNSGFFNKLLNHFVVASHIYLGNHIEATLGYNHLRRSELNIGPDGNGLNGFSAGLRVKMRKMQILYGRSNYQRNIAYHQFGLTLHMDRLFGF